MVNNSWQTSWVAFVEHVGLSIERGQTGHDLSETIASGRVCWRGPVAELRLDTHYASGIAVQMPEVRRALSNGYTLIGRHLFVQLSAGTYDSFANFSEWKVTALKDAAG